MIEQRRSAAAARAGLVELMGEDGRHAFVGERADRDGAGGDRFGALGIDAAIEPQNAEAGAESLFGMRSIGEHGYDQPFRARSDLGGPAAEAIGRPFGVTRCALGM